MEYINKKQIGQNGLFFIPHNFLQNTDFSHQSKEMANGDLLLNENFCQNARLTNFDMIFQIHSWREEHKEIILQ